MCTASGCTSWRKPLDSIRVLRIQSRICVGGPALNTILLSAFLKDPYKTRLIGGALEPGEKSMAPFAQEKGVEIEIIDEMGRSVKALDDLRALWKLIKLIRAYKPTVVHTHTAKAGAIGRVAAFLCRVPLRVHTFHGHTFHGYFSPFVTRIFIWIERILAMLSHRIVVISGRQKEDICETYKVAPKRKTRIVPLGFELSKMVTGTKGRFRKSLNISEGTCLVAILARLVPIKNHELLLRSIAHYRTRSPEVTPEQVRFVIIGDGELRDSLETLARELNITDLVVFAGWRSETPDIYADIDLNVLTSKNEGTPVTLIEGLACGVPILATDVGGIRDFADERHGRIVTANASAEEFGEALHQMLGGGLKRLPTALRDEIRARFDVSRLVRDIKNLYDDALS